MSEWPADVVLATGLLIGFVAFVLGLLIQTEIDARTVQHNYPNKEKP